MGLFDKTKKRALGIIDEDARKQVREEKAIEDRERYLDRIEKEQVLKEHNLTERMERRRMLTGEKPLSVREFGKSKLREEKNRLKIGAMNTFTRENAGDAVRSGAKRSGELFRAGAKRAAEYERRYEARQERMPKERPRRQREQSYGFDYLTEHPKASEDIQSRLLSSPRGQRQPSASDITSSLLGSGNRSSNRKRKSKQYDPFDFSDILG